MKWLGFTYRWTIRLIAGLLFLVSLAFAIFWVRSYRVRDHWLNFHEDLGGSYVTQSTRELISLGGGFTLQKMDAKALDGNAAEVLIFSAPAKEESFSHEATIIADLQIDPKDGPPSYLYPAEPSKFGFQILRRDQSTSEIAISGRAIAIPYWCPVAIFGLIPFWRVIRFLRGRNRKRTGVCLHCGYDLRATPHRCPECGEIPVPRVHRSVASS